MVAEARGAGGGVTGDEVVGRTEPDAVLEVPGARLRGQVGALAVDLVAEAGPGEDDLGAEGERVERDAAREHAVV